MMYLKKFISSVMATVIITMAGGTMPMSAEAVEDASDAEGETAVMNLFNESGENQTYNSARQGYVDDKPEPIIMYDFENSELSDIDATFTNGASLINDTEKGSKVLYLNGTSGSYMEFAAPKDEEGNALESYTVSFDVKNKTTGNYFNFYIGDGTSQKAAKNYLGIKAADNVLVSTVDSTSEKKTTLAAEGVQGNWTHFDMVVSDGLVQIYINNEMKGELAGYTMNAVNPSVIRFGFSPWSADKASNAYYDNITVYDCRLVTDRYNRNYTNAAPV